MKHLYSIIISLLFAIPCMAYDFSAPDVNGNTIYYNFLGGDSVEVTYETTNYNSYSGDVVIPESINYESSVYRVVVIGKQSFRGCGDLTSVTIPNSVIEMQFMAFANCSSLTSVHITDLDKWCEISFSGLNSSNPLNYAHHLFLSGTEVVDMVIPSGVTRIRDYAFVGCTALTSVTIPNSVKSIGYDAFLDCEGLTSVHITDITKWCEISFLGGSSNPLRYAKHLYINGSEIIDLVIPEGVTRIGSYAFYNCRDLTSVTIPNSVTYIGSSAFYCCINLSEITIPDKVKKIPDNAFFCCASLTALTIPGSVTSIGEHAFYQCKGLTSISIPSSVMSIGKEAFRNCENLTSIIIPNNVTTIESGTFSNCSRLTSVVIPNTVASIGNYAFRNCENLTTISIPNSVMSIGSFAFDGCNGLKSVNISDIKKWCKIKFGDSSSGCAGSNPLEYAHRLYVSGLEVTNLEIPDGIDSISNYAFYDCTDLLSITIPNSVISIGSDAFYRVPNIVYQGSATGSPWGARSLNGYVDGFLVYANNSEKELLACSSVAKGDVSIPNSVISITSAAFENCIGLTSVHISDLAKWCKIEFEGNFSNPLLYAHRLYVRGLEVTNLEIPDGIDSISNYAFYNCTSITSLTIPNSITLIGNFVFENCSKLDSVYCAAIMPPTIGEAAFDNISPTATLFVPYESIQSYKAISAYADAFADIKGFSDAINITETTADIIWLPDPEVTEYTITVYKNSITFAQYIMDGDGQVVSSQRFLPSIYRHKQDTTQSSTEYFTVSVDELEAGTEYTYTIEGSNSQQEQIYHEEGTFQTNNHEGLFDPIINDPKSTRKIIRNGKIYILRGDVIYDTQGRLIDIK